MSLPALLLLAVALGTDAFSLCLGLGMAGVNRWQRVTITLTVLTYHVIMPLIGWYIGEIVGTYLGRAAAFIGAAILIFLGMRMLRQATRGDDHNCPPALVINTLGLLVLGASVSMDALSVGFTLGVQKVNLYLAAVTFGVVAGMMTLTGLLLGRMVGQVAGERAQVAGGLILIGIGLKLLT